MVYFNTSQEHTGIPPDDDFDFNASVIYSNTTAAFSNASDDASSHVYQVSPWMNYAWRILWGCLCLFGNALIITVVVKFEKLQTNNNFLICSLSCADLMTLIMIPLVVFYNEFPKSPYYVSTCIVERTISMVSTAMNMISIALIAINNYIYLQHPLRYTTLLTRTRLCIILGVFWSYTLLFSGYIFFNYSNLQTGEKCNYAIFLDRRVYLYVLTPHFFVYLFFAILFNLKIAKIAWRQNRAIAAQAVPYDTLEAATSRSSKRITRMLAIVLGLYLLCLMPQYVVAALLRRQQSPNLLMLEALTRVLYWANTWINPLVYAWRLKHFRIAFKKLFTGKGNLDDIPV